MCYDNSGFGLMFDVEAVTNIKIEQLDANLGGPADHDVLVYFKSGSHVGHENVPEAWTMLGSASGVTSNGPDSLTTLPVGIDVTVAAGHTIAFYIAVTSAVPNPIGHPSHILYTNGTSLNNIFVGDTNLVIREGTSLGVPSVMPFQGGQFEPRQFNGAIHYSLCTGTDSLAPVLTCQATNIVSDCASAYDPHTTGMPAYSDNADAYPHVYWTDDVAVTNDCPAVEIITRTFYAEDLCGNLDSCVQIIEVHDMQPPLIECPGDLTVNVGASTSPAATGMVYTSDACDMQPFIMWEDVILAQSGCPLVELVERTWLSIDACGNTATCLQHIAIADLTTPPVLDCPPQLSVSCADFSELPASALITVTDCGPVDLTFTDVALSATTNCAGTSLLDRIWIATDEQGNTASCEQTLLVIDDTAPLLTDCATPDPVLCSDAIQLDFNGMTPGDVLTSTTIGDITITVTAYSKGGFLREAVVFNTTAPSPDDQDLGTPNSWFGGAGVNAISPDGFELSNNRAVGNALVVQNPNNTSPDDYFLSDSLIFEFSAPVFMQHLTMVDMELPQVLMGAGVFMSDTNGMLLGFVPFQGGSDNCLEDVCLMTPGVSKLVVYFGTSIPASGAVGGLSYLMMPDTIQQVSYLDECGSAVTMAMTQTFEMTGCDATLVNMISASDACGNLSPDTCVQTVPLLLDIMPPEILPPADLTIACDADLPAPDLNSVLVLDNFAAPGDIAVEFVEDIVDGAGCAALTRRVFRATDPCGNSAMAVQLIHRAPAVVVDARVYLLSAMDSTGSSMHTTLNGILPLTQPYQSVYGYAGGESVPAMYPDVVDWILIELVDPVTMDIAGRRAALLRNDGEITDLDGVSDVTVFVEPGIYELRIRHRNHLDIASLVAIDFSSGSASCDFTGGGASSFGMAQLANGMYAMINGDINGDQVIDFNGSANDKNEILSLVGLTTPNGVLNGYYGHDVNFDGQVRYNGSNNDKNEILSQVGLSTPNHVVIGQLFGL